MAVNKKNIQERINIPSNLNEAQRIELGRRIIEESQTRTSKGIDKNGKAFTGYSKVYKDSLDFQNAGKSSKVNLESTGDMLAELDVLKINNDSILIGYELSDSLAGQVEGNTIGSFGQKSGNPKKARDFIGLPEKVLTLLIEEIKGDSNFGEIEEKKSSIIGNILKRFG